MRDLWPERYLPRPVSAAVSGWRERLAAGGSLSARFAGGVFWSFAGVTVSNVAGLVTGAALARIMGREGYGEVGVVMASYALFGQLGGLGLGLTAVKYAAQLRGTEPAAVGRLLGSLLMLASLSYAIAGLALVVWAPELAAVLNRPALVGPLRLSGLVLFLQGIDSIQSGILTGYEAFRDVARVTMLRVLVNLPLTVLGAYTSGLHGVVVALIVSGLFTLTLNRIALNRVLHRDGVALWYGIDTSRLKPLWQFSLPAFASATLTIASAWALNAVLVNQADGYSQMGLFNAANQWRALGIFVPSAFSAAVLPIQASLYATRDHGAYHRSVTGNLIVQCAAAAVVVGVLAGSAPYLMRLYGAEYEAADRLLVVLALGWFFLTPGWILWNAAISRGQAWWSLLFNVLGTACLLAFALRFVGRGAVGIALALLFSGMIQVGLQAIHYYVYKRRDVVGGAGWHD